MVSQEISGGGKADADASRSEAAVFRLVIRPEDARARRKTAPPDRAMTPAKLKKPRRRPDYLAEADD